MQINQRHLLILVNILIKAVIYMKRIVSIESLDNIIAEVKEKEIRQDDREYLEFIFADRCID